MTATPDIDRPISAGHAQCEWGSDAIALGLRSLDLPYVALNPGASFRGLHDSLVNFLGNNAPQILLCLHEAHAVAIAHGYAKVTGRPMAALLHSNVGLMNATMAVFNAWCDRIPVILLGANGPVDAARRRPWIDWIHSTADQAAPLRNFLKWDNQPASIPAMFEALHRANAIARTAPAGPVYVCFDAALQEARLPAAVTAPDAARFKPALRSAPSQETIDLAASMLAAARRPVVLSGRIARSQQAWDQRVALCERLGGAVLTDMKVGATFPTDHTLHQAAPMFFVTPPGREMLLAADVILSLDWVDLGGTLASAWGGREVTAKIIHASTDIHAHNGWTMDHQALAPVDLPMLCAAEEAVSALLGRLPAAPLLARRAITPPVQTMEAGPITLGDVAEALRHAVDGQKVTLARVATGWPSDAWPFLDPLDFLGGDGGAGVGSGPGLIVGAALALQGSGRLPVAILGDGDFLMGVTALWTAARYRIALLVLIANNRSFLNDELHQNRIARERGRPPENRWIGQRLDDPAPDLCGLARAQGMTAIGPIGDRSALHVALQEAVRRVRTGESVVVDILTAGTYDAASARAMIRPTQDTAMP